VENEQSSGNMMTLSAFIKRRPLTMYFVLTFAISWGALLIMIGTSGMPSSKEQLDAQLPFAILAMLGGPSIAGLLLIGRVRGKSGFRDLTSRLLKWQVGIHWYIMALLVGPFVLFAVLIALSLSSPVYLPGIFASENKVSLLISGVIAGVTVGIFEELGWTGYAVPMLRLRYSILATGLIVGVIWGAWHILSNDIWPMGTYSGTLSPGLFAVLNGIGFLIGQLPPFRILMVWIYDRTGSLMVVMLMHASLTAATLVLGPLSGSGEQLLIYDLVLAFAMWAVAAAFVLASKSHVRQVRTDI
jgi:membrane protease YdiL (CAAX protease family)